MELPVMARMPLGNSETFLVVAPCPVCGGSQVSGEYLPTETGWQLRNLRICPVCQIGFHASGHVKAASRPPRTLAAGEKFQNQY